MAPALIVTFLLLSRDLYWKNKPLRCVVNLQDNQTDDGKTNMTKQLPFVASSTPPYAV